MGLLVLKFFSILPESWQLLVATLEGMLATHVAEGSPPHRLGYVEQGSKMHRLQSRCHASPQLLIHSLPVLHCCRGCLQLMGRHMEGNMYLAQPPLVTWGEHNSTLTHYTETASESVWERWWMRYRHWGFNW